MRTSVSVHSRPLSELTPRRLATALLAFAVVAVLFVPVAPATAQEVVPVVGVEQGQGFATVSWTEVAGAEEYEIERTPMDGDEPAGPGEVVGIYFPDRHIGLPPTGEPTGALTFADSGFSLGERYEWRVRAVVDDGEGAWSEPVAGDTQAPVGPEEFHTGFELSDGEDWTLHEDEVEVVEGIAAASDRVSLETIGETYEGRPVHLATIGYPTPPAREGIADGPSVYLMCTIHGPERSGREACMIMLRELAFSEDPRIIDLLSRTTVLMTPTANPDGQAVGRRTNTAGLDLNRDSILIRHPETIAIAEVIRDAEPNLLVDAHEKGGGPDTDPSWPRSPSIYEPLILMSQDDVVIGQLFGESDEAGWSMRPYTGWANNNWEAWHHNMAGMKNMLGVLLETAQQRPDDRPGEDDEDLGTARNQKRRVYTHLWSLHSLLDYHHENLDAVEDVLAASEEANIANEGPIYLDGAFPDPYEPPYGRSEPSTVVLEPFCGYRMSAEQYATQDSGELIGALEGQPWTSPTVGERLASHGVEVTELGSGIVQVPLAQPFRPLLPFMLDPELDTAVRPIGTPNLGMVDATRLDDRSATVVVGDVDTGVPNRVDDVACSLNDLIADEQAWPSRGRFIGHVGSVLRDAYAEGLVDNRERSAITRAALRLGS